MKIRFLPGTARAALASAILLSMLLATSAVAEAQSMAAPDGSKTLAATMNVYVFPAKGQSAEVQSQQESECYAWAVKTTGLDPFHLTKQAQQSAEQAAAQQQAAAEKGKGTAAKGAEPGCRARADRTTESDRAQGHRRTDREFQEGLRGVSRSEGLHGQV